MTSYEDYETAAKALLEKLPAVPKFGIVCGSGLGDIVDSITEQVVIPYNEVSIFPHSSAVHGHDYQLVFGYIAKAYVVCFCGRWHSYEGYNMKEVVTGIRFMNSLGVKSVFLTNAAGGLDSSMKVGDIMIIEDHIDFVGMAGKNCFVGPNDERWGPRFQPIDGAYDLTYRKVFCHVMEELKMSEIVKSGIYFFNSGPCFESPAEIHLIHVVGADAVGMSTVPEVNCARHMGMKVMALSLITDVCKYPNDNNPTPDHEEILKASEGRTPLLSKALYQTIEFIAEHDSEEDLTKATDNFNVITKDWYKDNSINTKTTECKCNECTYKCNECTCKCDTKKHLLYLLGIHAAFAGLSFLFGYLRRKQ